MKRHSGAVRVHTQTVHRSATALRHSADENLTALADLLRGVFAAQGMMGSPAVDAAVGEFTQHITAKLKLGSQALDELGAHLHGAAAGYVATDKKAAGHFASGAAAGGAKK